MRAIGLELYATNKDGGSVEPLVKGEKDEYN